MDGREGTANSHSLLFMAMIIIFRCPPLWLTVVLYFKPARAPKRTRAHTHTHVLTAEAVDRQNGRTSCNMSCGNMS